MELLLFNVFILITVSSSRASEHANLPFPVYRIKEVKFVGGVAGATSYTSASWRPEIAFLPQQPLNKGWHIDSTTLNLPVMIWYDFKSDGIRPSEVSFQPAETGSPMQGTPTSYQYVGSNDGTCNDDSTWTILCEDLSDLAWRDHWEVRYCKVKPEIAEKFRCLGIRALVNRRSNGYTSLRNIRMWERIESKSGNGKQEL